MERPTTELKLPSSGATIVFYSYLLTGEFRQIRKNMMSAMHLKFDAEGGTPTVDDLSGDITMAQEEDVLNFLIKEVRDANGVVVDDSRTFVFNLPVSDGDLVYEKANELSVNSSLSADSKKK